MTPRQRFFVELLTGVAAGVATVTAFLLVLGALVMALRLGWAGVPIPTAFSIIPKEKFLTAAAGDLVIPTVLFGLLFTGFLLLLWWRSKRQVERFRRRVQAGEPVRVPADPGEATTFDRWDRLLMATAPASVVIGAPFTLLWLLSAAGMYGAVRYTQRIVAQVPFRAGSPGFRRIIWHSVAALLSVSVLLALASQQQKPVNLERAAVQTTGGEKLTLYFIGERADAVYLGRRGAIESIPQSEVRKLTILKPARNRESPDSLGERIKNALPNDSLWPGDW